MEAAPECFTDNGTEFKNKILDEVCEKLGIKRVYSPVYTPQSNGKLEGFHRFFKACIAKHITGNQVEWDEVVPLATAAYKFFPCQASRESPFVLMFGRDPITPSHKFTGTVSQVLGREGRSPANGCPAAIVCGYSGKFEKGKEQRGEGRK